MSETLLSLEHVRVQFDDLLAVDDLNLELRGGDLLGLVGPNGAGKTTTLRAAAGLQPVTTGKIRILGDDVFESPTTVGHHLAFTPDTPQVYDTLTVEQFLRFIGDCYGLPDNLCAARIDHWLDALWLTEKRKTKIGSLSRGMRQRLAVARSLVPNPSVILMDEPAAGLDPAGRVEFRRLLASLRDQGKSLIVSSHILADLADYCTHIAIMGHGQLIRYGTVAQVAGRESQSHARYAAIMAQAVGDVDARLEPVLVQPNVACGHRDPKRLEFDLPDEPAEAAKLLRALMDAGFPVAEFRVMEHDLEQAYLQTGIRQVD